MQLFTEFLFKSFFISASLFAYYLLFLRNRKMHNFNRFYLLATVAASLTLPLLHFRLYTVANVLPGAGIKMLQAVSAPDEAAPALRGAAFHLTMANIALALYGIATLAILAVTVYKIIWVLRLKRTGSITRMGNVTVVHTANRKAPFSFFNLLFWRNTIALDSEHGRQILRHEMAHISQRHSIDKMFMQMVVALCWVNPIYWLLQKELSQVHEFIADEAAIQHGGTSALAAMLLQCHYGNMVPYIVNPFFYSSVKRRIIMLKQNKTNYAKARKLLTMPLLAGAAILCSCTVTKNAPPLASAHHRVLMALDAAHGGNDLGATGPGGIAEKGLTLLICAKMSQLAGEYNIEVMQTRPDDNYVTLNARAEKANAANADVFVSIHVNQDAPDNPVHDGYEVIVSEKNQQIAQSKMLASAVISNIAQMGIRPVFVNKGIHVLKSSNTPAIAIECGRIDNAREMEMLQDNAKLESLCRNILSGIVAYENSAKK